MKRRDRTIKHSGGRHDPVGDAVMHRAFARDEEDAADYGFSSHARSGHAMPRFLPTPPPDVAALFASILANDKKQRRKR
jgi:hypothetical protein